MSKGRYNGEKPVVQLWCCHDLQTADGRPFSPFLITPRSVRSAITALSEGATDGRLVLKRMTIGYVVYSIQTRVCLNRWNHPFSKHIYWNCECHKGTILQGLHRWTCCTIMSVSGWDLGPIYIKCRPCSYSLEIWFLYEYVDCTYVLTPYTPPLPSHNSPRQDVD